MFRPKEIILTKINQIFLEFIISMLKKYFILIAFISIILTTNQVYGAEPIKITLSSTMDDVIFDGKWTSQLEWKQSSWNTFTYEDQIIQFRSAHQGNFIYFLVDFQTDTNLDYLADKAMICLDTKNDKTQTPNSDDFCFLSILDGESIIFQGTSDPNIHLSEIPNSYGFVANATSSDEFDRYSKTSHSSYEFKIPTELVGRYSTYGIFLVVYDEHSKTIFNWPQSSEQQTFDKLNPTEWGEMISLDKSLPEFQEIAMMVLASSIVFVIVFARKFSNQRKI